MKHSFSSLTLFAALLLIPGVLASSILAQSPPAGAEGAVTPLDSPPAASSSAPAAPGATGPAGPTGQQLVAEAARRVHAEPAIAAELRYKIDAFGHELLGTGRYLQLGRGTDALLRLDLKMQVGGKPATVMEVRGPEYYYVRRDVPPLPATLGRVDLRALRRDAELQGQPHDALPQGNWILLGGLARLMSALEDNFRFDAPRADELEYSAADGAVQRLPIWVIGGRWKMDKLKALAGGGAAKKTLPEQFPDRVELVLGRTEELPLFPYRITYLRDPAQEGDNDAPAEPRQLLALELFGVSRKGNIAPTEFDYKPQDQEIMDLTATFRGPAGAEAKLR